MQRKYTAIVRKSKFEYVTVFLEKIGKYQREVKK
jgi:hypothetical protein